ncbi:hypothetical protein PWO55_08940 [Bacillus velezensis]|uniref:hypothetical protein n=1 Tax=Bacillus amyloliquefaciens group TaxID=1938374 RepID=UPI0016626FC5|nr:MULTISPECIES: hypothetical protein [Bacillus amyloliquefaciens group]UXZ16087.1 hypothetical protein KI431_09410 [Bacillus siamensis]MCQ9151120.1 hypothetical protein [Bacillus amyloliquefaciens]QSZ44854.1 hypothetical protein I3J23_19210 [Bacillus amyloliquefaciens]URN32543.1 hypothetical protein M8561_09540 [Bacillus velezensis]USK15125.1 hypothetical protein LIT36_09460 [Bacillus velezensis]
MDWVMLLLPIVLTTGVGWFINSKLEKQKSTIQKRINNFSLYNEKKHMCLAELYKLIKEAEGYIFNLRGLRRGYSFDDFNSIDIVNYLDEINAPIKVSNEVKNLWENGKVEEAKKKISTYESLRDNHCAENALVKAKNYFLMHELYITDDLVKTIEECFKKLEKLKRNYDFPDKQTLLENDGLKDEIKNEIELLRDEMKKELSMNQ